MEVDDTTLLFTNHASKGLRYNDFFFLLALLFILLVVLIMLCMASIFATKWTYKRRTREKVEAEKERHRREEEQWKENERRLQEEAERRQERLFQRELLKIKCTEKQQHQQQQQQQPPQPLPPTVIKMEPPSPKKIDNCHHHHRYRNHHHHCESPRSSSYSPRRRRSKVIREVHIQPPPAPQQPPPPSQPSINTVFVPQPYFTPIGCQNVCQPHQLSHDNHGYEPPRRRSSSKKRLRKEYECYYDSKVKTDVEDDVETSSEYRSRTSRRSRKSKSQRPLHQRSRKQSVREVESQRPRQQKRLTEAKVNYMCAEFAGPTETESEYSAVSRYSSLPDLRPPKINRRHCPTLATVPSTRAPRKRTTSDGSGFTTDTEGTTGTTTTTAGTTTTGTTTTGVNGSTVQAETTGSHLSLGPPVMAKSTTSVEMPNEMKKDPKLNETIQTSSTTTATWTPRVEKRKIPTKSEALAGYISHMADHKKTVDSRNPNKDYILTEDEKLNEKKEDSSSEVAKIDEKFEYKYDIAATSTPLNRKELTSTVLDMTNDPFCTSFPYWRSRSTNQPLQFDATSNESRLNQKDKDDSGRKINKINPMNGNGNNAIRNEVINDETDLLPGQKYKAQFVGINKN